MVKKSNQLPAKLLAMDPAEIGGRGVMFVSSNDDASASIAKLVGAFGFAAITVGKINGGGILLERGAASVLQNLVKQG